MTAHPEYFPRPLDDRRVIRRKTFALKVATPDEAAHDMELVGHDFYLFTELAKGQDALIYRRADGDYGLLLRGTVGAGQRALTVAPVVVEGPAPVLSEQTATAHLAVGGEPFVFFVDLVSGRGRVLYRPTTGTTA